MALLIGEGFDLASVLILYRNSYRCGLFFTGDKPLDPPRLTIFVIPKRFPMNCARDKEIQKAEANAACRSVVSIPTSLFCYYLQAFYHSFNFSLISSYKIQIMPLNLSVTKEKELLEMICVHF